MSLKFIKLYSNTCKSCYLALFYLLSSTLIYATTVAPPPHLGAFAAMSDELVLIKMIEKSQEFNGSKMKRAFKFEVIEHLKGSLQTHENIQLTSYGFTEGDSEFDILAAYKKNELYNSINIFLNDHKTWNQKVYFV